MRKTMKDEYIRREDAINAVSEACFELRGVFGRCEDALKALPSVDVAPVVHGKWMKEDRGHVEYYAVCDQCGFDWMWSDRGYFNFCPNCGAKMDGGDEHG